MKNWKGKAKKNLEMETNLEFLEYKQKSNEFLINTQHSKKNKQNILMLGHVFKFIHKNLDKLHLTIHMSDILPILHHSLRLELQTGNSSHIGAFVCALLNLNDNNNDEVLRSCLQILYQILETLSVEDTQHLQIGNEVFYKLIEILLSNQSRSNNANILACLQLYVKKFSAYEIITHLWNSIKDDLNSNQITERIALLQTFIHLFDEFSLHVTDFKQSMEFTQLVLRLLYSDQHDNRKCAYFLLKKAHMLMEEQEKSRMTMEQERDIQKARNFWGICINNFENLEENQSHLILPSLEQLRTLKISHLTEEIWIDILYRQILRHNNTLVRRWILEYLMENLAYFSLTSETQLRFMQALNDTALYNVENYMLPIKNISNFLQCKKSIFLLTLSKIDWKAVPLHFWLTQLHLHWKNLDVADISQEALVKLATKIRAMQNVKLREENIVLFNKLFSTIIDNMELTKYVQLIESLYNVSDYFNDKLFFKKIKDCKERDFDGNRIFTLRLYKILSNQFPTNCLISLANVIKDKVEQLDWTPGSLRFLMIFHSSSNAVDQFCKHHYGVDKSFIQCETPLNEIYENFYKKLATSDVERIIIKQKVTDCYVYSCESYTYLEVNKINIEELLSAGTFETFIGLTKLLVKHIYFIGRDNLKFFAQSLREHMRNKPLCSTLCQNLSEYVMGLEFSEELLAYYSEMLLELGLENKFLLNAVFRKLDGTIISVEFLIENALMANTKVGDPRIEEAYECKTFYRLAKMFYIRSKYIEVIGSITNEDVTHNILINLCTRMIDINQTRPKYYANSKEHRSIIHILAVFFSVLSQTTHKSQIVASHLWNLLLHHNNQPDATILYEIATAYVTPWSMLLPKIEELLKARTCTSSQELSLISLLYRSIAFNCDCMSENVLEKVIYLLWPLTMGPNFLTRLNSRLAIISLIDKYLIIIKMNGDRLFLLPGLHYTLSETISQEEKTKFENDLRFKEVNLSEAFDAVMDFTNAPYDEYNFKKFKCFPNKIKLTKNHVKSELTADDVSNLNVQRKLNPVADFMPLPDLYSYPECKEKMLYVVASLIDKIPNLGGIARTCEVLGIKNLVIDSKAHMAKADFKSLSMTAEKNLNIEEVKPDALMGFILQKKTEGFKIIGAEQTANSCSFVNFNFPKRSVLILGHEKQGIPPNLLGFLDFAVEIPQFGMIRSLNVHVTGALFMWEYCRQHIIEQ